MEVIKSRSGFIFTLGICLLFCIACCVKAATNFYTDEVEPYVFFICLYTLLTMFFIYAICYGSSKIRSSTSDGILLGALLLLLISKIFNYDRNDIVTIVSLIFLYFIIRSIGILKVHGFIYLICIIYLLEFILLLYTSFQQYTFESIKSHAVGTFYNSGLFAAFMIATIPFMEYLIRQQSAKVRTILRIILAVTIIAVITLTMSRAALLSLIIVLAGMYSIYYPDKVMRLRCYFRKQKLKTYGLLVIIAVLLIALFYFKENSSIGRILIWTISIKEFIKKPIFGWGMGSFSQYFPDWQANYFSSITAQSRRFEFVADITYTAFNEFLQLLIECGLVGFVIFALFVRSIVSVKSQYPLLAGTFKICVISFLIEAIFSYPFHSFPILLLFFISAALLNNLSSGNTRIINYSHKVRWAVCFVALVFSFSSVVYFFKQLQYVNQWNANKRAAQDGDKQVLKNFSRLYLHLNHCGPFLVSYGEVLYDFGDYNNAIKILKEAKSIMANEEASYRLGESYEKMKMNYLICYLIISGQNTIWQTYI